ncbi:hypothetical protein BRADI_4g15430v3 [Brachypodium distachyon]|uniref:USP domain-containing protein n=1 Tax=Brachypodium distachyon TaxID=15368 RepID=I1IKW8_BRADI|nr:hypothetical protein BRADI_4g15430v3 [Brachypodium distachyon]KQJ88110.1 hypothetical protein BRADI_4g15430v3 [Brachypodium distachyon]KQJ88111.1 hypothetical protein BRADI_4g15430v3 [Brachypodium distachyon]
MVNATSLVKSIFTMPTENTYILFRIELLVVVSTVLFLGMSILDIFRSGFHSSIIKAILSIVDSVSDSIVLYVMGAMQIAPFKNQLFPVWAIVLVGFRHSSDFISGYGIQDKDGRRFIEWKNVVKLLGVAFLNKTRGSMFVYPLWSLWCLQILRSKYRMVARQMAFKSVWHGKSSQLVSEYMRTDTQCENFKLEDCKADTMEGYRYLVYGETRQHIVLKKPRYVLHMDTNPEETRIQAKAKAKAARAKARHKTQAAKVNSTSAQPQRENGTRPAKPLIKPSPYSLITLDKIWQCDGALLQTGSTQGDKFKDLSLAFSLSRLLRCRLEDMSLHKDSVPITKNLIMLRIIREEAKRAFMVMELEMSFLNDYFNTRYPMVFWTGFLSLHLSFILSAATFAVACWLFVDILRVYKTHKDEVSHVINGVNVDMVITLIFMLFTVFKEVWEMAAYYLSDWARLLLASTYVRWNRSYVRNYFTENFIGSFFTSKIADSRWHGVLDQYAFLQSYDDSPSAWNFMRKFCTGAIPKKDEGAKLSEPIGIPECVKPAILVTLRSMDLTRAHLLDVIPSLLAESRDQYRWACFELPTSSHIILVWHIATSLCEIKFAQERYIDLTNPGFPLNALSYLTSFCHCCCCSPGPYLVNENMLDGDLKTRYTVANSLSRYCAYLLISKPDLLPDSFLVPKMIFQETVKDARRILKNSDSLEKRYKTLVDKGDTLPQHTTNSKENINIVQKGAKLAKELMREDEESRWEILAGVWADLLVHIAPSWNATAHKNCLESGGELITHIWALLWHCGIEKSMLWPVEGVPRNNAPEAHQNNNAENNSAKPADQWQAAGAIDRDDNHGKVTAATVDGVSFVNGDSHLIRGMQNLGNTCYFNALQGLLALGELRIKMLEQNPPEGSLLWEFKKLLEESTGGANGAGGTLMIENLFSVMSSTYPDFKVGVTEDSNHLLGSFLDGLNMEEPTMVKSLFRGEVAKYVYSKECVHTSVTPEVLDLSLAIPSKEHVSVEDCLDLYASGEVDDWYCTKCSAAARNASSNQKDTTVDEDHTQQSDSAAHQNEQSSHPDQQQTSTPNQDRGKLPMLNGDVHQMEQSHDKHKEEEKKYRAAKVNIRIMKAPTLLTIQLKRFDYVRHGRPEKLDEHVSIQEMLNITKYMDPRCVANEDYIYRLVAIIVHEGPKLSEGHNYSYVRGNSTGQEHGLTDTWFSANDEKVEKVSLEEVLECQAYILFYERVDQSKVKPNL